MYPIIGILFLMDMGRFLVVLLICHQLSSGLLLQYKKSALTSIMLIHQKEVIFIPYKHPLIFTSAISMLPCGMRVLRLCWYLVEFSDTCVCIGHWVVEQWIFKFNMTTATIDVYL